MGSFAGAKMLAKGLKFRNIIALALMAMLLLPSVGKAYPSGIAGPYDVNGDGSIDAENDLLDVAKEGCTCHNAVPTNSVQIILDDVPLFMGTRSILHHGLATHWWTRHQQRK